MTTVEQIGTTMRATSSKLGQQPDLYASDGEFNFEDATPGADRQEEEEEEGALKSTWSSADRQDPQVDLALEERKRRRLLAAFRLWRSRTEMQQSRSRMHNESLSLSGATSCSSADSSLPARHQHLSSTRSNVSQVLFVPTCASTIPFAASVAPLNLSDTVSEKKLWQGLALPLVLGCTIFLIAIWTRQISLVLMSDTIVMVVIMGGVFILMSGVAFWLAQEQKLDELSSASDDTDLELNSHRHSMQHPHSHHHHHLCVHLSSGSAGSQRGSNSGKCCNIAVIDYQPPDYYSAMRNSVPVNLYSNLKQQDQQLNQQHIVRFLPSSDNAVELNNDELQLSPLNANPPSYDQLKTTITTEYHT